VTQSQRVAALSFEDLCVRGRHDGHWKEIVRGLNLTIDDGEIVGLVGESGCGKSTTAYSAFGYVRPGMEFGGGAVRVKGIDVLSQPAKALRELRGTRLGLVPQNPMASFTPSLRVGTQIVETLRVHGACRSTAEARTRTLDLLEDVGVLNPAEASRRFPHELSGGQMQRVAIAAALACEPAVLVLDEPTTALDVTTQAKVLRLLSRLREVHGTAMLYVTHDLGVVGQLCDRVAVMNDGCIVEAGRTAEIFAEPRHPYTQMLLAALPGNPHQRGNTGSDDPRDVKEGASS
jgi:ABC-type dipeptide/oligopeptide/nickel transport system ATPase component